jgi:hypothetical protein
MSLKDKLPQPEKLDPLGLITPERMAELRVKARENVARKLAERAEKVFLVDEEKRIERLADPKPEYETRTIVIDAADHTDCIRIDQQYFWHGSTYEVVKPVYDQLREILMRGWRHEREISAPTPMLSNNRNVRLSGGETGGGARF